MQQYKVNDVLFPESDEAGLPKKAANICKTMDR
jgi:hypothetical protein